MTAILPVDIDSEWLIEWCQPRDRAELPPLDAALLDACPVALAFRQYARAAGLGLAGRLASVLFESVVFEGSRFGLAMHREDQHGAEVAFLLPAEDAECEIADLVAWHPESGRVATLLGVVGTLGLPRVADTWLDPPLVHETVRDFLLAPEFGLFVVDPELAAAELEGVTLACLDRAAASRLHARLAPFAKRPPQLVTPRAACE